MQKQTYEYKKAGLAQIDELVRTRLVVLRAANQLSDAVDLSQVERETYEYYKNALATGGNDYLVRIRDLLEQAILRGKRAFAEKILDQDPCLQ